MRCLRNSTVLRDFFLVKSLSDEVAIHKKNPFLLKDNVWRSLFLFNSTPIDNTLIEHVESLNFLRITLNTSLSSKIHFDVVDAKNCKDYRNTTFVMLSQKIIRYIL